MRKAPPAGPPSRPLVILFNKPFHVLCQFTDQAGRATLSDFIGRPGFYAAGRLDYDSEGLVVLTNHGQLQRLISDPASRTPKTYLAQVEGVPDKDALEALRKGVALKDGITAPAVVEPIEPPRVWPRPAPVRFRKSVPDSWLRLTITQGRNRQVRRMTAAVGLPTLRLIRVAVGQWELGTLAPGQWMEAAAPALPCARLDSRGRGRRTRRR